VEGEIDMRNILSTLEGVLIIGGIIILLLFPFEPDHKNECLFIGFLLISIGIIIWIIGYVVEFLIRRDNTKGNDKD
jgi:drug/metabolite transporter (DMT)-like permease